MTDEGPIGLNATSLLLQNPISLHSDDVARLQHSIAWAHRPLDWTAEVKCHGKGWVIGPSIQTQCPGLLHRGGTYMKTTEVSYAPSINAWTNPCPKRGSWPEEAEGWPTSHRSGCTLPSQHCPSGPLYLFCLFPSFFQLKKENSSKNTCLLLKSKKNTKISCILTPRNSFSVYTPKHFSAFSFWQSFHIASLFLFPLC